VAGGLVAQLLPQAGLAGVACVGNFQQRRAAVHAGVVNVGIAPAQRLNRMPRAAARIQHLARLQADVTQALQHALGNFAVQKLGAIQRAAAGKLQRNVSCVQRQIGQGGHCCGFYMTEAAIMAHLAAPLLNGMDMENKPSPYTALDNWIDQHFDEQVRFLQALVQIPTDTPPGNNAPHADKTAELLAGFGFDAEKHAVPQKDVAAYGMQSITNLIVRRKYGDGGKTIALNAHGDVVPPGEGWSKDPYGAQIEDGKLYGRAAAVSKSDFATFSFAVRALEAVAHPDKGAVELHFTYDEEFGGELGPGWLLERGLTQPDLMVAAGFSYEVVTAHNGCLQWEVTLHGKMAHAAVPDTGVDALQGAVALMQALYALNDEYRKMRSNVAGINHPYLNVGRIEGGTNTNVVPGKVVLKIDRRMIPEEDPAHVEASIRALIERTVADFNAHHGWNAGSGNEAHGLRVEVKRLLLAKSMLPSQGNQPLVDAIQTHAQAVFGQVPPAVGTPLYTDVRLYAARGIPGVIYGAGPRTVLESHAKRADERLELEDLRRATKVIARMLHDLLA